MCDDQNISNGACIGMKNELNGKFDRGEKSNRIKQMQIARDGVFKVRKSWFWV